VAESPESAPWWTRARAWWEELQPANERGGHGDRGALARLRRADVVGAIAEEATLALFRRLGYRDPQRLPRVATLAHVLAHVREDDGRPFGRAIGRASFEDAKSAAMSDLRFRRLVAATGEEEIAREFRRAVELAGAKVDVADLARVLLCFDDEDGRTRRRLTFDYFNAGAAAPRETASENAATL
jgi:CRISPR system Cascade subunit CasB